jgi:hypothetical protein
MECCIEKNTAACPCTYESCTRRGKCCECVSYHREKDQIPGCFFSSEGEKSYDRSVRRFIKDKR